MPSAGPRVYGLPVLSDWSTVGAIPWVVLGELRKLPSHVIGIGVVGTAVGERGLRRLRGGAGRTEAPASFLRLTAPLRLSPLHLLQLLQPDVAARLAA